MTKKLKFSLNGLTPIRSCKPHSSATTAALPRMERANAFTLAEVLITLGIIGVVAAVTMPTLIKNYQKKQTVTQLKKAYSELSQAISMAQRDLGTYENWDFTDFPTPADRNQYFYENVLKPNLKIVKYCAPSSNDCWSDEIYTLKETKYNIYSGGCISFITASGYSVYYWIHNNGSGGWFFIDLNGPKKTNILGKDVFVFLLNNGLFAGRKLGLIPNGMPYAAIETASRDDIMTGNYSTASASGSCSKTGIRNQGLTCAALIMLDGWEIKDDYPW